MTKKKKLILIFSIIGAVVLAAVATVLIIVLTKKNPEEKQSVPQCVAPEITVADEGIYWASVANAESYYYNYNNSEWTEAKDIIEFPESEGEYTLQLKAVDGDGRDGKTTEFVFTVAKMTVECERVDNTLRFEGDRIFFSVNGMEEGALGESKILDFSNDTTGTKYTVQYYAKGGYFSEEDNTFYLDSVKQTQELTTMQMLTMPTLKANEAGTHLVWTASENAQSYAVSVDGEKTTVSKENASVAFPMTEGEHVITVQAIGDGQTWYSSFASEYKMTTKREAVPAITYDGKTNTVTWSEKYEGKMQASLDGSEYATVNQAALTAQNGLSLKLASYYEETERTYYLESKPISFQSREVTTPKFYLDGRVTWNEEDEKIAKKYYVSVVGEAETPDYDLAGNNVRNVSTLSAGKYTLSVYAADYVEERADKVVFYLPSESKQIDFAVLEKPTLSFETGKLLWEIDPLAASYEYRVNGTGEWETATENGVLRTRDMATYEVRAVGSEEQGKYALTSNVSTLFFDPALEETLLGAHDLALFDNQRYIDAVASATSGNATKTGTVEILTSANASSAEQAILAGADGGVVKVTAGKANPRVQAHWGNSDGMQFTLFQPITFEENTKLVFRVYVVPNADWQTAYAYNYSHEYLNAKGRTIDEYGNTYAFFDEENNLVGYQSSTNTLIDGTGAQIGKVDMTTMLATVTATGKVTKARTVYGVLDDGDNLLGIADEKGAVKKGDTLVGTLNEKGELVNASGKVLSTSTARKINDLTGNFYLGASGLNMEGTSIRTQESTFMNAQNNAVAVGEWTEVSVRLGASYVNVLSNIQTVYMHFAANGQEGCTFYIDEIRYEEIPPLLVPAYLKEDGDETAITYQVGGPTWAEPVMTEGSDGVGEYMEYSWAGKAQWGIDALTFNFHGLTLNAGDKVYLHTYTPSGSRWPEVWVNGMKTSVYLTHGNEETKVAFTATETTTLDTLTIRPQSFGQGYEFSIRIYGVYVVRAE